jgi:hypothetical protein
MELSPTKARLTNAMTIAVIFLTAFQLYIPNFGFSETNVTIISAITLFLVSAFTLIKQWVSEEIQNAAAKYTLFMSAVALFGGLSEWLDWFPSWSEHTRQVIRTVITFIVFLANFASKIIWPNENTKSKL